MFCNQCGTKQTENTKFCYKCGNKIVLPNVAQVAGDNKAVEENAKPKSENHESAIEAEISKKDANEAATPKCNVCGMNLPASSTVCYCGNDNKVTKSAQSQPTSYPTTYRRSKKKTMVIFGVIGAIILLVGGVLIGTQIGSDFIPEEANALELEETLQPTTPIEWQHERRMYIPTDWRYTSFEQAHGGHMRSTFESPNGIEIIMQQFTERLERMVFSENNFISSEPFIFDDGVEGLFVVGREYYHWINGERMVTLNHSHQPISDEYLQLVHEIAATLEWTGWERYQRENRVTN